jgi:hypothetical protein
MERERACRSAETQRGRSKLKREGILTSRVIKDGVGLPSGECGSVFAPLVRLPVFAGRHRLLYALASLLTPKSLPALWGPTCRHSSRKPMCILETQALGSTLCKLGRAVLLATYLTLLYRYVRTQLLVA